LKCKRAILSLQNQLSHCRAIAIVAPVGVIENGVARTIYRIYIRSVLKQ
jgi:hypothetical protein